MSAENVVATIVTIRTNGIMPLLIPQQFMEAKICAQHAYMADALESGSTIKIARLPKGAMPLAWLLVHAAMTGAVTGQIGDSGLNDVGGDDDRWVVAGGITSMAAAGVQIILPRQGDYTITAAGVYTAGTLGVGYICPNETDVVLKTGGANITGDTRFDIATVYALCG